MLTLNGVKIPEYVKVNSIEFSILPSIENNLTSVRGRKGQFFMGREVGQRTITVQITLIAEEVNGVMSKARDFAKWLYHDEPVKLVIADEPDKHYLVVFDGESTLNETVNVGQGTLTFICTEPFAFGEERVYKFTPEEDEVVGVRNTGNVEVYPVIDLEVTEDITDITVASADRFVSIGEPAEVGTVTQDTRPRVLWDELGSLANWSTGISIDGGDITGTMKTDGYRFLPDTWGTHSTWHGSALVKSLPRQIQDFECEFKFTMKATSPAQVGRCELYLFDNNNNNIGKVGLAEYSSGAYRQGFFARAGNVGTGNMFTEERNRTCWANFSGMVKITRIGKVWTSWIGILDSKTNQYHTRFSKSWTDVSGKYLQKLAKIQVHLGAYSTHYAPTTIALDDVKVFERLTLSTSQAPIIAKAGDTLTIDNEKAIVLLNGEPYYSALQPDSTFINLKEGLNGITISPPKAKATVSYTERWL